MQLTRFQRIQLPQISGAGEGETNPAIQQKPTPFAQAGKLPIRVLIRNTSIGVSAFFSIDDVAAMNALPLGSGPVWELPAGETDVFVLAPNQRLIGAANAPSCFICVAVSEALPIDLGIGVPPAQPGQPAPTSAYPSSASEQAANPTIVYKKGC